MASFGLVGLPCPDFCETRWLLHLLVIGEDVIFLGRVNLIPIRFRIHHYASICFHSYLEWFGGNVREFIPNLL